MQEKLASIQEQKKNERKLLIKLCQTGVYTNLNVS